MKTTSKDKVNPSSGNTGVRFRDSTAKVRGIIKNGDSAGKSRQVGAAKGCRDCGK